MSEEHYDIADHKSDLDLLEDAQPNLGFRGGEWFMEESFMMMDCVGKRCVNPEDFEFEKIELHQGDQMVEVSKHDVIALAKHFDLLTKRG